jgi:hypothetical protein
MCSSSRLILHRRVSPDPHHQISTDSTSTEACREGGSARDLPEKIMAPWMTNIKFPRGTQFTFGTLTSTEGEDGDLKMLLLEAALERVTLVHGHHPYSSASSSTSGGACLGSDPWAGLFIRTIKIIQGILVATSILQPSTEALSSSSSAASISCDSTVDYHEIGGSTS